MKAIYVINTIFAVVTHNDRLILSIVQSNKSVICVLNERKQKTKEREREKQHMAHD